MGLGAVLRGGEAVGADPHVCNGAHCGGGEERAGIAEENRVDVADEDGVPELEQGKREAALLGTLQGKITSQDLKSGSQVSITSQDHKSVSQVSITSQVDN